MEVFGGVEETLLMYRQTFGFKSAEYAVRVSGRLKKEQISQGAHFNRPLHGLECLRPSSQQ